MFFAGVISLVSVVLVVLFLPETITKKAEKISLGLNDIIPVRDIKRFVKTPKTRNSLLLFFLYNCGFFLFISNLSLFAQAQYSVTADQASFFMAWIGTIRVILQTLFIAGLLRAFGEDRLLVTGIVSMVISMLSLAFSAEYLFVFVPLVFLAYGSGVSRPILTSRLTNNVTQTETGTILGVNNSLNSVAQIITPVLGGFLIQYYPSQTLPLLSAMIFISLILFKRRT
jgi:DHA1 family tetracycline resistance protein-like MFS transporter